MENENSRRKFLRNLAIMGGATTIPASIFSSNAFSAPASAIISIPENTELQDLLLMSKDNATHLAYFDPAEEAVTNPGMGVTGYVVSDHMHFGGNSREEWLRTEGNVPMKLDRKTFDEFIQLPHIDNLYFRADWRTFQLQGEGPFTVFAPTNDAFAKLPAGTVETLVKPENKGTLTSILTYHVVPGTYTAKEVMGFV